MLDALSLDLTPVVAEQPDPLLFATVSWSTRRRRTRS